jgi:hypothetical protein
MSTATEDLKAGDRVRLNGRGGMAAWDGLTATVKRVMGTGPYITLDEGLSRPDGYDTSTEFCWDDVTKIDTVLDADSDLDTLRDRVTNLEEVLANTRTSRDSYAAERDTARQELADFKILVRDTAVRYAEENDWCSTVMQALEEMGIDAKVEKTFTVSATFQAMVPMCGDDAEPEVEIVVNGDGLNSWDINVERQDD